MTNIHNLFKFIEDKEGKKVDPAKEFKLKLIHNPEELTPEDLEVGGNLDLSDPKVTSLPDNLKVGGDLNLRYSKITSLPDNLKVGGYLYLYGSSITSLPDNLEVGGDLYLKDTPLSKTHTAEEIKAMVPNVQGTVYS